MPRTRRPAAAGNEKQGPAPRGRIRPRAPPCRLRGPRPVPRARRWSDCRCANRCCRTSAAQIARRHGRRFRIRRMSSDRSASRARRWSDLAARRREWRAWKSRECVRSSTGPHVLGKRWLPFIGPRKTVKARHAGCLKMQPPRCGARRRKRFLRERLWAAFSAPTPSSGGSAGSRRGRPARCGRDWRTGRRRPSRGRE